MYLSVSSRGCKNFLQHAPKYSLPIPRSPSARLAWFLKDEGYDKTTVYLIVEVAYLTLFLLVRAVLGTYLLYKIMNSQLFDLDEKLISIMFYIVSMAFVYQIVGYVLYKYKTKIGALRDFLDDMGIMSEHR